MQDYKAKQSEFKRQAKTLEDADDQENESTRATSINSLSTWLEQNQKGKPHTKTDPNKLPFRTPDGKVRAPIESEAGFKPKQALFGVKNVHLAGAIPAGGISFPKAALDPSAADLSPSEDVQITPAIQAKAVELGNHPVQIHNWVSNNIEFIPTYGSIQGSDMTLQTKRGNAFDTASLEIALLRAAGIPARYVYGTIQMPVDRVMNWVGGVTKPEAALNLLGQGGIPSIGLVTGGQVSHIKMEHVWVSAYVDYIPSRGAVNRNPNTWVPLDASYKQYTYTQGMDIKSNVPLDANSLLTQAQAGATVNQAEGWVQNVNSAAIQNALTGYQTQVKSYIDSTKPNATVGDVLGSKAILQKNYSILLGTLPYKTLAVVSRMAGLPDSLRHKFQYSLYADDYQRAMGNAIFTYQQSLPNLAGKKVTLSFAPSTQADADAIASYLPKPHADGSPILASELPTSLPGYLIRLTAELRVDGLVVASGGNFTMGQELTSNMGLFDPASGWDFAEDNKPIAGEYIATYVDLQGISSTQVQAVNDRLTAFKAKLSANQFDVLRPGDLTGDSLYCVLLAYFSTNWVEGQMSSRADEMIDYRKPSFGSFMVAAQPKYWFGVPKSISFPGLVMDVDRYTSVVVAKDNDPVKQWAYLQHSSMRLSAYEHIIPERIFSVPTTPVQGISAMKALAIAANQGQKI